MLACFPVPDGVAKAPYFTNLANVIFSETGFGLLISSVPVPAPVYFFFIFPQRAVLNLSLTQAETRPRDEIKAIKPLQSLWLFMPSVIFLLSFMEWWAVSKEAWSTPGLVLSLGTVLASQAL